MPRLRAAQNLLQALRVRCISAIIFLLNSIAPFAIILKYMQTFSFVKLCLLSAQEVGESWLFP